MITILKKLRCCCTNLYRTDAVRYGMMTMMLFGLLSMAQPAAAQSSGNQCLKEATGLNNPSCTANDVRIGRLELVSGPDTCDPDDPTPFQVTLLATIESGPQRWDIGIWVNEAGGSAKSDTSGPNCYRDYLHPLGTSTTCNQTAPSTSYYNQDLDSCGDLYASNTNPCGNAVTGPCSEGGGTCLFTTYTLTVDVVCSDSDGNGTADLGTCTSWDQNAGAVCGNELGTNPGTGSKCNCGPTDIIGLHTGCTVAADCTEGTACTTTACVVTDNVGECVYTPITCDDNSECTSDSCDPVTGCVYTPISCDDGNACTADSCDPATGCVNATISCDDNSACTTDSCDPATGCVNATISCDDNSACTTDSCDPATGCVNTTISCDDNSACTTDSCDPATGCVNTAISCDDNSACTTDSCDPATGCVNTAISCDDNSACTTDSCDPATGCVNAAINCNDGSACTSDSCDPATGCVNAAINCNDGSACTSDSCDPATGCVNAAISCDDGDSCTADSCNPATGCVNVGSCPTDTQIAPTATSCQDYTSGTAADLEQLLYGLKGDAINSVSPGVLFLYDTVHLDAACSTITVTQTDGDWTRFLQVHQGQVVLYDPSCNRLNVGSVSIVNGNVTITGVPPGDYVLGIKYDPTGLRGYVPPTANTTYNFAVATCGAGSGSDSVDVNPKP